MNRRLAAANFGPHWRAEGHPDAWAHVEKYLGRRHAEQRAATARVRRTDYVARHGELRLHLHDELNALLWEEIRREIFEGDGSGEIRGILDRPGITVIDEVEELETP